MEYDSELIRAYKRSLEEIVAWRKGSFAMSRATELLDQAEACRDLAARARRLAKGLSLIAERDRVNNYATALDRQAGELEKQAAEHARNLNC
jgi:hypothetical protein